MDVNADGFVSPIDALLIVNDLNFRGVRKLPNPPMPPLEPPPYLDVSGDGFVSPLDALLIINYLNGAGGEGEGGRGRGWADADEFVRPTQRRRGRGRTADYRHLVPDRLDSLESTSSSPGWIPGSCDRRSS